MVVGGCLTGGGTGCHFERHVFHSSASFGTRQLQFGLEPYRPGTHAVRLSFCVMKNDQSKRRTYRRDDGVLMVEFRPGQFVNERTASLLEDEPHTGGFIPQSHRGRRRRQMREPEDAR
jgi:hypothetical protein